MDDWPLCVTEICGNLITVPYVSVGEPSDGHPQEEMVPDFAWFRPMGHNALIRMIYYPEMEI